MWDDGVVTLSGTLVPLLMVVVGIVVVDAAVASLVENRVITSLKVFDKCVALLLAKVRASWMTEPDCNVNWVGSVDGSVGWDWD